MLNRSITHNQFLVFGLYSLFFSFVLGFLVIKQTQTSVVYDEKNDISYKSTSVLVFGDMMLDRNVREKINKNGAEYPFELIKNMLSGNDIVVVNAEGSFTSFDSVTLGKNHAPLNFTFDPLLLNTLKKLGFTLIGQANNHTLNFGVIGFAESTSSITKIGLNYFGDPSNIDIKPYIANINGEKIGFVAYNEFSYQGKDKVILTIQEVKNKVSYLIVYPHWGEEYNQTFTQAQQKLAHEFIDAGADAVIGTHPHVIEPIEIYNNKLIFYSIGNFIFDQAQTGPKTEGLAIKILLKKDLITYEIEPLLIKRAQVSLMDEANRQTILNALSEGAVAQNDFKKSIGLGTIKIVR